jgi:hypothetical protein
MPLAPETDRVIVARLMGASWRHAHRQTPTARRPLPDAHCQTPTEEAVAELRGIAQGRTDLLAEATGLTLGGNEHNEGGWLHRLAAPLLVQAGADPELFEQWLEEGRRRASGPLLPR